jgi:hypothetical protein
LTVGLLLRDQIPLTLPKVFDYEFAIPIEFRNQEPQAAEDAPNHGQANLVGRLPAKGPKCFAENRADKRKYDDAASRHRQTRQNYGKRIQGAQRHVRADTPIHKSNERSEPYGSACRLALI